MEYEKKYKEIIGEIRKAYLYAQTDSTKAVLEKIFPELKESENEKIRNSIIHLVEKSHEYGGYALHKDEAEKMLAWLEKQGEQKPVEEYNITGISSNKSQGKLGEIIKNLKTTWSEKDEVGLANAMWAIEQARTIAKDENDMGNLWYAERWLKSLRPQKQWKKSLATADLENSLWDIQDRFSDTSYEYRTLGEAIEFIRCTEPKPQWKPSEEQIKALDFAIDCTVYPEFNIQRSVLKELLEQLKKLKE